jgi:hypothetical protein
MKKLFRIYKPYMIRPIIYKTVTKSSIGLVVVLLWNRWGNREGFFSLDYGFSIIGMFMIAMSWFNYLGLDGIDGTRIKDALFKSEVKKENKHKVKHGMDFVDEKIISFDELEDDERIACKMASNIITGGIFVVATFISMLL